MTRIVHPKGTTDLQLHITNKTSVSIYDFILVVVLSRCTRKGRQFRNLTVDKLAKKSTEIWLDVKWLLAQIVWWSLDAVCSVTRNMLKIYRYGFRCFLGCS